MHVDLTTTYMALGSFNKPIFSMTWCYLHYKFLLSCAKSLNP